MVTNYHMFNRSFASWATTLLLLSSCTVLAADHPPDVDNWLEQALAAALAAEDHAATAEDRHQALLAQASAQGRIPVIVRLRMDMLPEAALDAPGIRNQRERLGDVQERVMERLTSLPYRDEAEIALKRFELTPAFAMLVDEIDLQELFQDPDVLDVIEDRIGAPALAQSVPLIGADGNGTFSGRTGQGRVVAILDTGVMKNHPFLSGKVVSEACYSSNVTTANFTATSLCPGGVTATTANNSGLDCSTSIAGCGHGTHVAGIAAGKGNNFSGVARDAQLIAIQVFSRFTGTAVCGNTAPCARYFTSDLIKGLERVHALRNTHNIAAANLSLGRNSFSSACDNEPEKQVIDNLRAAGIATVVASGNNGFTSAMNAPACISSAISVGNTTKQDDVRQSSNSAGFLDLLAPGTSINSSVPGNTFGLKTGTSMSAPHVAGAWAVLRQAKSNAGVAEILNVLKNTGISVTDTRTGANNRVKPRIQVDTALAALIGSGVPGKPTTISPSGTITTTQPTYTWNAVSGATWYRLWVNDSTGNKIANWYTASQTNCAGGTGTCSIKPNVNLATGAAVWWVRGWNSNGEGPWSDARNFTVSPATAFSAEVTNLWPVSNARTGQSSTLWAQVRNTGSSTLPSDALVWYYVSGPNWSNNWVGSASASGLNPGANSWYSFNWAIPASATPGTYTYWARVYRGNTPLSNWSAAQTFTVSGGVPGKPTTISPSGTITTNQPTYTWNAVSGATWYRLWVNDSTGNKIATWYTASQTNCAGGTGTCSIRPNVNLATGGAVWWVQGWNSAGEGPWSDGRSFTVSGATAGFDEQFKSGNAPNWTRHSGSWSVVDNEYYFTQGVANRFSMSTYNAQFSDLDYSARIWRSGGNTNANALLIRASGAVLGDGRLANYYWFAVTRSGFYSVWKTVNGQETALRGWTASSAINQGSAWNTLRVVAKGNAMAFYINGSRVWQGTDNSLSNGRVGVGMFRDSTSTGNGLWVDWARLDPNPQTVQALSATGDGETDTEILEGTAAGLGQP